VGKVKFGPAKLKGPSKLKLALISYFFILIELPAESMRRMYSHAVDLEVEDKTDKTRQLERLVESSTHFGMMNVLT
jgi:hypothetical protein